MRSDWLAYLHCGYSRTITCEVVRSGLGQCIACTDPATVALTLKSGRVARVCDVCLEWAQRQCVYFVRGAGRVKIGVSRNPAERLKQHQIGSPVELDLWHVMEGDPSLERALHLRFASARVHGEWFDVTPEIVEYVQGATACLP